MGARDCVRTQSKDQMCSKAKAATAPAAGRRRPGAMAAVLPSIAVSQAALERQTPGGSGRT